MLPQLWRIPIAQQRMYCVHYLIKLLAVHVLGHRKYVRYRTVVKSSWGLPLSGNSGYFLIGVQVHFAHFCLCFFPKSKNSLHPGFTQAPPDGLDHFFRLINSQCRFLHQSSYCFCLRKYVCQEHEICDNFRQHS